MTYSRLTLVEEVLTVLLSSLLLLLPWSAASLEGVLARKEKEEEERGEEGADDRPKGEGEGGIERGGRMIDEEEVREGEGRGFSLERRRRRSEGKREPTIDLRERRGERRGE